MKNSKRFITGLMSIFLTIMLASTSIAHPGRTDANGGHNKTSDGTYHYHSGDDRTIEHSTPQNNILSSPNQSTAQTISVGDELGDVLNTDIKTYINGNRIPSYNINNKSAVLIKDLINYGFDSVYNDQTRSSSVTYNPGKKITPLTNFDETTGEIGSIAFSYVHTDIIAYVNGKKVESFNIKGNLAIFFGDLSDYGTFAWDGTARASKLTLYESAAPVPNTAAVPPPASAPEIIPAETTIAPAAVPQISQSKIVYWVPNGEVYHSTRDCRSLSRSKDIRSGSIAESGKSRGCNICVS